MRSMARAIAVAGSVIFFSPFAFGQATEDGAARLDPVTVTSRRVAEDLQDVPVSVTVLRADTIDVLKASAADVRFLSGRVPSVVAESSFGRAFPRFYIRGIGNTDFDLNSTQPISLVYDEVPYESPILKGFPVFDLDRIEVLRGPQGTLFGRNTPGGLIKFESVRPGFDTGGYVRAAYGSFNLRDVEAAANLPVIDNRLAVRLSGLYQERDGSVDNGFSGERDRFEGFRESAVRLQALLRLPELSTDVLFNIHGRENDGTARLFRANIIARGRPGIGPGFDRGTVSHDAANFLGQESWGVTLRLDHRATPALTVTSITGYERADIISRLDNDGGFGAAFLGPGRSGPGRIPFSSETSGEVDDLKQVTQEIRAALDDGERLRAQAGVFFFEEDVKIFSRAFNSLRPGRPLTGLTRRINETDSLGLFASVSFDLTERLSVSGGARWTQDEKRFSVARLLSPTGAGPLGPISNKVADDDLSWDATVSWTATPEVTIYGRAAKGFRGPSTQGRLLFGNDVSTAGSETVLSVEAGAKALLLQDRLRLNGNLFHYRINDQQLTVIGGLTNTVALFNADQGEGYGFELDAEARPLEDLSLAAALSWNRTEILDPLLLVPGCGAPCTVLDPAVLDANGRRIGFNISGNSFPYAPEWIVNLSARYARPFGSSEAYVVTDWSYKDDTRFLLYESAEFQQPGYWEGGLRLGLRLRDSTDLSVFVRNLTDEAALEGAIDFNNLAGFVNEPRSFGIEIRRQF